jgi:hypothetical protein
LFRNKYEQLHLSATVEQSTGGKATTSKRFC